MRARVDVGRRRRYSCPPNGGDVATCSLPRIRVALANPPENGLTDDLSTLVAHPEWLTDDDARQKFEPELTRLCVHYLARESNESGPRDPVARFHLGNGASIERVNWAGDTSDRGLVQSAGIMVNYAYDLDAIVANHEAFVQDGEIALSQSVKSLLAGRR